MQWTRQTTRLVLNSIPFILASYGYGVEKINFVAYICISAAGYIFGSILWDRHDYVEKLKDRGSRYEPIFIIEYPGKPIGFPEQFDGNFLLVEPGTVGEAVVEEKKLLHLAGNQRGVEVIGILYQDGINRCENVEMYERRCIDIMTAKLNAVNDALQRQNPSLYNQVHHNETVSNFYEWNP